MTPIQITVLRHSAFYSPLICTMTGGFLREEGLQASYTLATPQDPVEGSLVAGKVQVVQSAVATSFAALERGEVPALVHFAQINERDGFFLARRETEAGFDWSQLVGRRVLVDHFFQPMAMFRYALKCKGVDAGAITIIDAGEPAAMEAAFRAGEGDYVHLQGPSAQQLEHEGIARVVASVGAAVGPVAFSSLCATREWLETERAIAFIRAYRKASRYVVESSAAEIAEVEEEYFPGIERSVLAQTIAVYQRLGCWTPDPVINQSAYECLLDVFDYAGGISRRHPYEAAIVLPPDMTPKPQ